MEFLLVLFVIFCIIVIPGIKIIKQYERGVVFTLGRFTGVRQPGLRIVIPYI